MTKNKKTPKATQFKVGQIVYGFRGSFDTSAIADSLEALDEHVGLETGDIIFTMEIKDIARAKLSGVTLLPIK